MLPPLGPTRVMPRLALIVNPAVQRRPEAMPPLLRVNLLVTGELGAAPRLASELTCNKPEVMVVMPVYTFAPLNVAVLVVVLVTPPEPARMALAVPPCIA